MDYGEFRRQLGKAGLTAKEFAALVKLNCNSVTNYSQKKEVPAHWAIVVVLMGELAEHNIDFKSPILQIKLEQNKTPRAGCNGRFGGEIKQIKQIEFDLIENKGSKHG
jgi:hypothetical protein